MPLDELHEVLEKRPNHFPAIEQAAEAMHEKLSQDRQTSGGDLMGALKAWLKREHDIAVRLLPVHAMPLWRRRFDRHSMRLFLSERLSLFDQLREVAMEACLLEMRDIVIA